MSKLIDIDDVANAIYHHFPSVRTMADARAVIEEAPSIDICFCGECKHCSKDRIKWSVKDEDGNWIDTKCNLCRRTKLEVNPDDFCSYGEREESRERSNYESAVIFR